METELLLYNGRIHTLESDQPLVSVLLVRGSRIAYLGDDPTEFRHEAAQNPCLVHQGQGAIGGPAAGQDREEFSRRCSVTAHAWRDEV